MAPTYPSASPAPTMANKVCAEPGCPNPTPTTDDALIKAIRDALAALTIEVRGIRKALDKGTDR